MKLRKSLKNKVLSSVVMSATVMASLSFPVFSTTALADDDVFAPSEAKYQESVSDLEKYSEIYFGGNYSDTTQHKWIVAGLDNDNLVLLCDPDTNYGSTIFDTVNTNNYYGGSFLDDTICGLYANDSQTFTMAEKNLMEDVEVAFPKDDYYTDSNDAKITRKMYSSKILYNTKGSYDRTKVFVGSSDSTIDMDLKRLGNGSSFWTRSPLFSREKYAIIAGPSRQASCCYVRNICGVVPAFHMNIGSALFASTAKAVTLDAEFDDDGISTIRYDGSDIITSDVNAYADKIVIDNPTVGEFVYVQWSDASGDDFVKSFALSAEKTEIKAQELGLDSISQNCKVWTEVVNDNLTYAKINKVSSDNYQGENENSQSGDAQEETTDIDNPSYHGGNDDDDVLVSGDNEDEGLVNDDDNDDQNEEGKVILTVTDDGSDITYQMNKYYELYNSSDEDIDMTKLVIRYYYTRQNNTNMDFYVDSCGANSNSASYYFDYTSYVKSSFKTVQKNNRYVEISFKNGAPALPSKATLRMSTRQPAKDYSAHDQTLDYSYQGSKYVIVLYKDDVIWGIEPSSSR